MQFRGSKLINIGLTCKDKTCVESVALASIPSLPRLLHLPLDIGHTIIPQDILLTRHHSAESKYKGVCPGVQTMLLLGESEVILKMLSVLDGKNMTALNGPLKQSRLYNFIETGI
ncbi:hypothetical protein EON65_26555 [archaeon]|nr:MAG: hypothetical protein EON65_26555 [archaeon]